MQTKPNVQSIQSERFQMILSLRPDFQLCNIHIYTHLLSNVSKQKPSFHQCMIYLSVLLFEIKTSQYMKTITRFEFSKTCHVDL